MQKECTFTFKSGKNSEDDRFAASSTLYMQWHTTDVVPQSEVQRCAK